MPDVNVLSELNAVVWTIDVLPDELAPAISRIAGSPRSPAE